MQSIFHLHTKISFNIHALYDIFVLYYEQRHGHASIYVQYLVLFHDIEIITNDEALFLTIFLQIKVYVKKENEKNYTGRWEVIFDPILLIHNLSKTAQLAIHYISRYEESSNIS